MRNKPGTAYKKEEFANKYINGVKYDLFHIYLDKPAMHGLLPKLEGKEVLCIGCGSGRECDYIKRRGASEVVGIDLSEEMIKHAKENYKGIEFRVMSMDRMSFPGRKFDVIYADMSVHYAKSMRVLARSVSSLLKPKGLFIFSTSHPISDAMAREPKKGNVNGQHSKFLGYTKKDGRYTIFGDYFSKRVIKRFWFDDLSEVSFNYAPLSEIFDSAKRAGLVLDTFLEPKAPKAIKKVDPNIYERDSRIPKLAVFRFVKV